MLRRSSCPARRYANSTPPGKQRRRRFWSSHSCLLVGGPFQFRFGRLESRPDPQAGKPAPPSPTPALSTRPQPSTLNQPDFPFARPIPTSPPGRSGGKTGRSGLVARRLSPDFKTKTPLENGLWQKLASGIRTNNRRGRVCLQFSKPRIINQPGLRPLPPAREQRSPLIREWRVGRGRLGAFLVSAPEFCRDFLSGFGESGV
jgi:hypothetical protein